MISSCGGIIFRRRAGDIEFFFIKDPYQRWTFPKGKQIVGESAEQTAIREIREETGLSELRLIAPIGRTSFRFTREGQVYQKNVQFFLFEAPSNAEAVLATPETLKEGQEPIFESRWAPIGQVFSVSSYKNSDRLLAQAIRMTLAEK